VITAPFLREAVFRGGHRFLVLPGVHLGSVKPALQHIALAVDEIDAGVERLPIVQCRQYAAPARPLHAHVHHPDQSSVPRRQGGSRNICRLILYPGAGPHGGEVNRCC
jgi:hypothetical protein